MVMATYTCLWEFDVSPESVVEFEQRYGPAGECAQLDTFCEQLTIGERSLGEFIEVSPERAFAPKPFGESS